MQIVDGLERAFEGCLPTKKRNEVKCAVKKEERGGDAPGSSRFEEQFPQRHDQRKHANQRKDT